MNTTIPYGRQEINESDILSVISTLESDYLTQGPKIKEFETKFAEYIGAKYAVAVSNGTAALHLSVMALGLNPGEKVITTPITFAASANCIRYCGGDVVFSDIDSQTYLLDPKAVRHLLENSPKGTYKGIIPVDFAGRAVNLEEFRKLADEFGLWIIEDACHAPGGFFIDSKNQKQTCGNGQFTELSVFSFHPVKHIACGEGGMITTNDEHLYKKLIALRSHGITREMDQFENSSELAAGIDSETFPAWYMEMQMLGYNYRLTDFQAALGISQLTRAEQGLTRRIQIAEEYEKSFRNKPYIKGQSGVIQGHAYHLYVIEVENRLGLYNFLKEKKIFAQIHYIPCHLMPYYQQFGWKVGDMPAAESYYKTCISLPMFPSLKPEEQKFVIVSIETFFANE